MPYIKHNIDFIEYSHSVLAKDGNSYKSENKCEKNKIYDKNFIDTEFLPCLLNLKENKNQLNLNFIWKILFKKQLIDSYNIKFNENVRKWEDREFVIEYINCCKNVVFIEKSLYTYICGDSQEHLASKYYKTLLNECIENTMHREIVFKNKYEFSGEFYINHIINVFYGRLLEIVEHEDKETSKIIMNDFINNKFIASIFSRRESCGRYYNAFKKYIFNKDVDGLYDFAIKSKNEKPDFKQKFRNYIYKIKHLKS